MQTKMTDAVEKIEISLSKNLFLDILDHTGEYRDVKILNK